MARFGKWLERTNLEHVLLKEDSRPNSSDIQTIIDYERMQKRLRQP
jgi:hypothetical protein